MASTKCRNDPGVGGALAVTGEPMDGSDTNSDKALKKHEGSDGMESVTLEL